jgi:hypothetical protein
MDFLRVTKAEEELLTLLRGEDADNFRLEITYSDGKWSITTSTMEPPGRGFGKGASFSEAWVDITPWWALGRRKKPS